MPSTINNTTLCCQHRYKVNSSTMVVNYISATSILLIFLLKSSSDDSVDAFTPCPSRAISRANSGLDRQRSPTNIRQNRIQLNLRASDRHDYIIEANSDPNVSDACTFTEEQIHHLIAKRLECKKRRNFEDADRILEALNKNGIYIQDKARKYRVDGENHFGRRKHYVQRGGNYGGKENLAEVEELVEERARYKRMRDFFRSDDITSVLREKYRVRVDDRRREWSFIEQNAFEAKKKDAKDTTVTEFYVPTPLAPKDHATHTMDDETKDYIQDRLMERSIARKSKDYKTADRILEALTMEYFIVVDDRTKEWKVISTDDSYFDDTENDPFVKEATLSQRSAFVQTRRGSDVNDRNFNRAGDSDGWFSKDDSLDDELSRIVENNDGDEDRDDASRDDEISTVNESPDQFEEISAVEEEVSGETADDLNSLTVVALKEKLRMAGLPVSGKKRELIDRILSASSNE